MRAPRLLLGTLLLLGACAPAPDARGNDSGALPPLGDRAAWYARLRWTEPCEQARREDPGAEGSGVQSYAVGPDRYLVEVQCSGGAYQGSYNYVLYDLQATPARATLLRFPSFDGERWSWEADVAGVPSFVPEAKELELFSKARGVGDCGSLVRYAFPEGRPRLLWLRARECSAELPGGTVPPPGEWPLVPVESLPAAGP